MPGPLFSVGTIPIGFPANNLKEIATVFQKYLRTQVWQEDPKVLLFGSVANGRGQPGLADLDFFYGSGARKLPSGRLREDLNQALFLQGKEGIEEISGLSSVGTLLPQVTVTSPVQIRVGLEKVEILVYPQLRSGSTGPAAEPLVLKWF